ncbi:7296_t:CDS:2, partial [Ambispora leptoticha]
VDLEKYEENDLGDYENIEIKFKSGKGQRSKAPEPLNKGEWTKPTNYQEQPKQQILVSGLGEHQQEILLEKEVENLEDDEEKLEQLEQEKEQPIKEILIESHKASQKK